MISILGFNESISSINSLLVFEPYNRIAPKFVLFQLRVEEADVSRCFGGGNGDQLSSSVRRVFVEKNFQMDTQLRECEIVHTEIEQMIFNVNMKLNVS